MFISFEGTEGVGKSTLIAHLHDYFQQHQHTVVLTREPGGTPLAEKIRDVVLDVHDEVVNANTELLLMYASRVQHISQVIQPALVAGKTILCDRFMDASLAYQGFGRGLDLTKIQTLNQTFVEYRPDLTLWLDAPVEIGLQRAVERGKLDRFEQEKVEFFQRVRAGYQYLLEQEPQRIKRIDATLNEQEVLQQALTHIQSLNAV